MAFAVGFFFSFRLAVAILSIKLFGPNLQTGSAIKLALGFLLFGAACFISLGAATRTLSSLLQPSSVRWGNLTDRRFRVQPALERDSLPDRLDGLLVRNGH